MMFAGMEAVSLEPECRWNSGRTTAKPPFAPPQKARATDAPGADGSFQIGSERQQFLVRVRRLAHALDGVKILQCVHAGQRLRLRHEHDILGNLKRRL